MAARGFSPSGFSTFAFQTYLDRVDMSSAGLLLTANPLVAAKGANLPNATLTLTGNALTKAYTVPITTLGYNVTMQSVDMYRRVLDISTLAYSVSAQNVNFLRFYNLVIAPLNLTAAAQAVNLLRHRVVPITAALSFNLTLNNVEKIHNRNLVITTASYTAAAQPVLLQYKRIFPIDSATNYTLSVNPAGLYKNPAIVVDSALSFTAAAQNVSFRKGRTLFVTAANVTVTANDVTLIPSVLYPVPTVYLNVKSSAGFYMLETVQFNGEPVPASHMEDGLKLDADGIVDLYQIILADNAGIIYLKKDHDVTWQGNHYEGTGVMLDGVAQHSDDEVSRPKFTIFNPNGVYSYLLDRGMLDFATVVRYRVLKEHIDYDLPIYRRQQWRVSRIASVKNPAITLELRDILDGQNYTTPARMFIPPDFPLVSLY